MTIQIPLRKGLFAISTAALVVLAVTGCSALGNLSGGATAPERDAETNEILSGGTESAFSMQVGDCFNNEDGSDEVYEVPTVPCSEPHDNEVVYIANLEGADYPGTDAVIETSQQLCVEQFQSIVGFDYMESELDIWPLYPTEGSWNNTSDREVVCSLWDPAGQVSGTLVGAAR